MYKKGFAGFGSLYGFLKFHISFQNESLGFTNISFVLVFYPPINASSHFLIKPGDAVGSGPCWVT